MSALPPSRARSYAYSETSAEARDNFRYFLRFALPADYGARRAPAASSADDDRDGFGAAGDGDDADFVILLNGCHSIDVRAHPAVARGAAAAADARARRFVRVIERENECFDFGTWGIGLRAAGVDVDALAAAAGAARDGDAAAALAPYEAYVLINSSVRGPFVPAYVPARLRRAWWRLFTAQLGGAAAGAPGAPTVGLVGTTVHCYAALGPGALHLQSMFVALDRAALAAAAAPLLAPCVRSKDDAIYGGELPLSQRALAAGRALRHQMLALGAPAAATAGAAGANASAHAIADATAPALRRACARVAADTALELGDPYYPREPAEAARPAVPLVHPLELVFYKTLPRARARATVGASAAAADAADAVLERLSAQAYHDAGLGEAAARAADFALPAGAPLRGVASDDGGGGAGCGLWHPPDERSADARRASEAAADEEDRSHVAEALLRAANTELAELRATVSRLQAELGRSKRGRVELL